VTDLKRSVAGVAVAWGPTSPYYRNAEELTWVFWGEKSIFPPLFAQLDLENVIELACGHGRHAELVAPRARRLTLMDIHPENLAACRERLAGFSNVSFVLGTGFGFTGIEDGRTTAIYCYDSMVHFAPDVVQAYLQDTARVLAPGGMALYHHSNRPSSEAHYSRNPGARNDMTQPRFRAGAEAAGLAVVESTIIQWGGVAALDAVTLLRKPEASAG
jgi:SAM-dependent methyltransferase